MNPGRARRTALRRTVAVAALDCASWLVALTAVLTFFEWSLLDAPAPALMATVVVAQIICGWVTGLYRGRFRRLGFDEAGAVAFTAIPVGILTIGVEYVVANRDRGGQIIVLATSLAVLLMFGHRYLQRLVTLRRRRRRRTGAPIVVYGAGEGGERAVHATLAAHDSAYRVAAFVDDDPAKQRLRIAGVPVQGTGDDVGRVARRVGARSVLLALPAAEPEQLQELHARVEEVGLETLVMPPVQRLVGRGGTGEFQRYRDEEILRRKIVHIDTEAISDLIAERDVLVTGAGGSIGSEIVRQLTVFGARRITALDHDDSRLHATLQSLDPDERTRCTTVLADVRDPDRLHEVIAEADPSVVFHAAALKHVPALEVAPGEAWKTNVVGTSNVLTACAAHGVAVVVNISTDKAADPGNVLGFTKRITERMTAAAAETPERRWVSVRFGNVIGSRGSALETFEQQIASGGPVTVTHPDVTRYFMAIREAVRLTMQSAAIGRPGETLVLDMGSPLRVLSVAEQMIENSGRSIEIEFTGLREGEKMHEVLLGLGEDAQRPFHPMIDHVRVPPLELVVALDRCAEQGVRPISSDGLRYVAYLPAERSVSPDPIPPGLRPDSRPTDASPDVGAGSDAAAEEA